VTHILSKTAGLVPPHGDWGALASLPPEALNPKEGEQGRIWETPQCSEDSARKSQQGRIHLGRTQR